MSVEKSISTGKGIEPSDWLTADEFERRLRVSKELTISFDGEFEYDEDQDDVHPKDFREDFRVSGDVAMVLKHDGSILRTGSMSWPRSVTGKPKSSDSNAGAHVREVVHRVWGEGIQESEEERIVGKVNYSDITRRVTVFRVSEYI